MDDPVLVEVARGPRVESRHRGALAIVDADGGIVLALGDVEAPVYPRSAVKAFQALPLVAGGAAARYGLTDAEIALACASHGGEPAHVATAAGVLAKIGLDAGALECGAHAPTGAAAAAALVRAGVQPGALHNNCSGKHAGFLCLACHRGAAPGGYVEPEHPVQEAVREALERVIGVPHAAEARGVDGCSIPTYAVPLVALARGFARFATGTGLSPADAIAARRIRAAVAAEPFMVAGTGRFDTEVTRAFGEAAFVKVGAEGVHGAALPALGFGIALKCDDGARRGAELVAAALLERLLAPAGEAAAVLAGRARPTLRNWRGREVGALRAAPALARALERAPGRGPAPSGR